MATETYIPSSSLLARCLGHRRSSAAQSYRQEYPSRSYQARQWLYNTITNNTQPHFRMLQRAKSMNLKGIKYGRWRAVWSQTVGFGDPFALYSQLLILTSMVPLDLGWALATLSGSCVLLRGRNPALPLLPHPLPHLLLLLLSGLLAIWAPSCCHCPSLISYSLWAMLLFHVLHSTSCPPPVPASCEASLMS